MAVGLGPDVGDVLYPPCFAGARPHPVSRHIARGRAVALECLGRRGSVREPIALQYLTLLDERGQSTLRLQLLRRVPHEYLDGRAQIVERGGPGLCAVAQAEEHVVRVTVDEPQARLAAPEARLRMVPRQRAGDVPRERLRHLYLLGRGRVRLVEAEEQRAPRAPVVDQRVRRERGNATLDHECDNFRIYQVTLVCRQVRNEHRL